MHRLSGRGLRNHSLTLSPREPALLPSLLPCNNMESIVLVILKAVAIGVIISAPMGPVGVLCIQRTLSKGRIVGFCTGIGAAISDLVYCILTAFCLSFVEDFILRNQSELSLCGSVLLTFFALYLFRANPTKQIKPRGKPRTSVKKSILTGYAFTFSNPLIVFLIMSLFARFSFLDSGLSLYHYFFAFLFIFLGALAWWYAVTFFVNKIRAHFNLRSLWYVNRITGSIILIFAIVGIFTSIMALYGH